MSEPLLLYVTVPDAETGKNLARQLIAGRAAACVNLIPGMISIYEWEGAVEEAAELVMIVKTNKDAAARARDIVSAHHPYDCPCILALPVDEAASGAAFCTWISQQTGSD